MYTKKGFTLIELLVVIAIIGILSSIVMVSLSGAKTKSRDSKRAADIRSIQVALELYYTDYQMYPWNIYKSGGTTPPDMGLAPNYLPVVPTDPSLSVDPASVCAGAPTSNGCYSYVALRVGSPGLSCNGLGSNPYPTRYHIAAVFEDTSNKLLTQDVDSTANANGFGACSNSNGGAGDFDGTSIGDSTSYRCTATAGTKQPNGTETCFDMTP